MPFLQANTAVDNHFRHVTTNHVMLTHGDDNSSE